MKAKTILKKASALLLILALLLSFMPPVYAEDSEDPTGEPAAEIIVEDENGENGEDGEILPEGDPDDIDPDEETVPGEPAETDPEEESEEPEEEPEEIPEEEGSLFPGMPEGTVLSAEAQAVKAEIADNNVAGTVAELVPGKDYIDGEVTFFASTEEEAEIIAAAYGAELVSYNYKIGKAKLAENVSVVDALTAAGTIGNNMPAVAPNYIISVRPNDGIQDYDPSSAMTGEIIELPSWDYNWGWDDCDPFIKDPTTGFYQWHHDMLNTYEAWPVLEGTSLLDMDYDVRVGVIDSGCSSDHDDLYENIVVRDTSAFTGFSNDDTNGHGTHVCGIIAAEIWNKVGGAGVNPYAQVYSYNALPDNGSGQSEWICASIVMAADDGCDIINMSLGSSFYDSTENEAIQYAHDAGVTVIAAMGNDGSNTRSYPAAYKNVIAVAAVDKDSRRAFFSNYGSWCDIAAPGVDILSTCNEYYEDYNGYPLYFEDDGEIYGYMSGTSQATPMVTGAAALYMSAYGYKTPAKMESILESAVRTTSASGIGAGILDVSKLFKGDKAAPAIVTIVPPNEEGVYPSDVRIGFTAAEGHANALYIIYTLDGTTPTVKGGKVTNGELLRNGSGFSLKEFAGKTVTVKARAINAQGVLSKVATLKMTIAPAAPDSLWVTGAQQVISGKSATYKALVHSDVYTGYTGEEIDYSQKVTWSIVYRDEGASGAKISSAGKLTTKSSDVGDVVIRATSTEDSTVYVDYPVSLIKLSPVETISISKTSLSVYVGYYSAPIKITKLVNAKGKNVLNDSNYEVSWTSSNENIVSVNGMGREGYIWAVSKGTATIKATVGGKSVTCKITVKQPVQTIQISGSGVASIGSKTKYKAVCLPTNASSKSVKWSFEGDHKGVSVDKNGYLTVSSKAVPGSTVILAATAKDKQGAYGTYEIQIVKPVKKITLYQAYGTAPGTIYNSDESIRQITLFSTSFLDGSGRYENSENPGDYWYENEFIPRFRNADGTVYVPHKWTSSNPKVAEVDENGRVYGVSGGTATITCKAMDGSGTKVSFKVKVITPASYIKISSNRQRFLYSNYFIAAGKTAKHKVTYGDTYGKPNVKKVAWSFTVEANGVDITDEVRAKGLVKFSSSGKLTVKKGIQSYFYSSVFSGVWITVTATAQDGLYCSDTIEYYVTRPTSSIGKEYVEKWQDEGYNLAYVVIRTKGPNIPTVKSSNPKVLGYYEYDDEESGRYGDYYYHVFYFVGEGSGTAKITFTMNDGSTKDGKTTKRTFTFKY